MRSLSLTRSSPAPDTVTLPPKVPSVASTGSSSITSGTSSGAITRSRHRAVADPQAADRLAVPLVFDRGLDVGAEAPQHVEQRRAARVQADVA